MTDDLTLSRVLVVLRWVFIATAMALVVSGVFEKTKAAADHLDQGDLLSVWLYTIL